MHDTAIDHQTHPRDVDFSEALDIETFEITQDLDEQNDVDEGQSQKKQQK